MAFWPFWHPIHTHTHTHTHTQTDTTTVTLAVHARRGLMIEHGDQLLSSRNATGMVIVVDQQAWDLNARRL